MRTDEEKFCFVLIDIIIDTTVFSYSFQFFMFWDEQSYFKDKLKLQCKQPLKLRLKYFEMVNHFSESN